MGNTEEREKHSKRRQLHRLKDKKENDGFKIKKPRLEPYKRDKKIILEDNEE